MGPVLDEINERVKGAESNVRGFLRSDDTTNITLSDLEERGLSVAKDDYSVYEHVVDHIAESELASRSSRFGMAVPIFRGSQIMSATAQTTASRRLDESIRDEQDLAGRKTLLEFEVRRLSRELEEIGRPTGVTSAVVILVLYSLLGIVAPVVVMAFAPDELCTAWVATLVGMFVVGLFAVLAYIFWYAKTLDDPIPVEPPELH